ncbi:MAG: hypothetical protein LBE67_02215 [Kocuria palustris]|nr:hypothetical protein [Kocuria palustris]
MQIDLHGPIVARPADAAIPLGGRAQVASTPPPSEPGGTMAGRRPRSFR